MTLIHTVLGFAVVILSAAAGVAYLLDRPPRQPRTLAGWALGLLVVQIVTGMFMLTATSEGPDVLHVALPLIALVAVGAGRLTRGGASEGQSVMLALVYGVAAAGALVALVSGLTA